MNSHAVTGAAQQKPKKAGHEFQVRNRTSQPFVLVAVILRALRVQQPVVPRLSYCLRVVRRPWRTGASVPFRFSVLKQLVELPIFAAPASP